MLYALGAMIKALSWTQLLGVGGVLTAFLCYLKSLGVPGILDAIGSIAEMFGVGKWWRWLRGEIDDALNKGEKAVTRVVEWAMQALANVLESLGLAGLARGVMDAVGTVGGYIRYALYVLLAYLSLIHI